MAWGGSAVFTAWASSAVTNSILTKGTWRTPPIRYRLALFDNTVVPDRAAPAASAAYNQGTWLGSREVAGGAWPGGGGPLITFDDPAGEAFKYLTPAAPVSVDAVTLAGACGDLMWDPNIANLGQAFHDYGGTVDITGGTFTVTWAAPPGCIAIGV
jgi:hypothetical protein